MSELALPILFAIFLGATCVIAVAGTLLAGISDRLADTTGLGEAVTGALLLGAATSLPGLVTTITAAAAGRAEFALSNAVGGIAAQTAFLGLADIANRQANLEHQAASLPNILSATVLIALLGGILLITESPDAAVFGVHPGTPALFIAYVFGVRLMRSAKEDPQWLPRRTSLTHEDVPDRRQARIDRLSTLILTFVVLTLVLGAAGWTVAVTGMSIAERTVLGDTIVGGFLTAVSTSLPELVTAVAAVRRGALTLAVGNIIGGNAFDCMFAVAADVAYTGGSIYHAMSTRTRFMIALSVIMVAVLLAGLVTRERRGVANIGYESFLILVFYVGGFLVVAFAT